MLHTRCQRVIARALFTAGLIGLSASVHAYSVSPVTIPVNFVYTNPALSADDVEDITGYAGDLALVYKQNAGIGGTESGVAAPYYITSFNLDLSGGSVVWGGGSIIVCPTCYMVVKDGNNAPNQYIFTINDWNGQETINLSGFWPANGSISHVAIFNNLNTEDGGGTIAAIPEADTYAMLLAGLGLVGFAARRKLS